MQSTNAQSPPVPPPPAPSVEGANEEDIREPAGAANDKSAPVIEVLTQKLTECKNLIRAKVSDDSNLVSVKVKYAHDGFIKSSDLVLEQDTTFKGLVSVMAPSAILVFEAVDAEGNMAQTSKWFEVDQVQKNFIEQFLDWLRSLFS